MIRVKAKVITKVKVIIKAKVIIRAKTKIITKAKDNILSNTSYIIFIISLMF